MTNKITEMKAQLFDIDNQIKVLTNQFQTGLKHLEHEIQEGMKVDSKKEIEEAPIKNYNK